MKNIQVLLSSLIATVIGVAVATTYIMKHPDLENLDSIKSSWLSKEEKEASIYRVVRLGCDERFRQAFIPGVSVVQTGEMNDIEEKLESYQYLNQVSIIYQSVGFRGSYICSYPKSGDPKEITINVSMDRGAEILLKK